MNVVAARVVVERINIVVDMRHVVIRMKYVVCGFIRVWNIIVIHPVGMKSRMH